ncbi:hypothetical protein PSYMO_38213, partial [Pseudomonas amygdali pv. mori str. 301020]
EMDTYVKKQVADYKLMAKEFGLAIAYETRISGGQ